nr:GNAT family N-acetyltransferase [uncultured Devosia sp.]
MMPDQLESKGGRLLLRRPIASDLDRLFEIYVDPQTNLYNPFPMTSWSEAAATLDGWLDHWAEHYFGLWAIAEIEHPEQVLGFGGLSWRIIDGSSRFNLGYRFAREAWGRGYATEMGQTALVQAFGALHADAVYAYVRPANAPSIRVLGRLGMTLAWTFDDVKGEVPSLVYRALPI